MIQAMYVDCPVTLKARISRAQSIDLDLYFDRFRQTELSLGFAWAGGSYHSDVSASWWEINDVNCFHMHDSQLLCTRLSMRSLEWTVDGSV